MWGAVLSAFVLCRVWGRDESPHDGEVAGQVLFHWRGNGPCGAFVY
ncbi:MULTISPECIES: hypothetical protein [unclassified Bartonella]